MIVFGKTKKIKTASATSTYPAIITCVGDKSSNVDGGLIKLSFYCPSTMDGHPMECAYCGSNIVEAPVYPHNGAEAYDFQVGGVICISYEDGNLNTPQFVRYVKVTEDVITYNKRIIDGSYIPADESLHIDYTRYNLDILKSPRLQKALALLPAVKKSASGDDNDFYYSFILGRQFPLEQDRAYVKAGLYGAELLCTDFPNTKSSDWWDFTMYLSESKYRLDTQHSFLDICSYLVTDSYGVSTVKPEKIIDDVFKQSSIPDINYINAKSHPLATYLFVVLSGLPRALKDFENQAPKLYPSAKSEAYNEKIIEESTDKTQKVSNLKGSLMSFYTTENWASKYKSVWGNFISVYGDELKKCYACILNDNLVSLSMMYNLTSWDNVMFAIMAVIATSWPMLETSITESTQYIEGDTNLKNFFKTVEGYLINNKPVTGFNLSDISYISNGYADAYIYLMTKDWKKSAKDVPSDFRATIVKNMTSGIKYIINNWSSIGSILAKTYDSAYTEGVVPPGGDANSYHIWCVLMNSIGNAYGVAGLMGNLSCESGLKSNRLEGADASGDRSYTAKVDNKSYDKSHFIGDSKGYGLAQWTYHTRKEKLYELTVEKGKSIADVDTQLDLIISELQAYGILNSLKNSKSVRSAAVLVCDSYEKPRYKNYNDRTDKGQHYYDLYANTASTSGGMIVPLKTSYRVSCEFRGYSGHTGIDLAVPVGTSVYASQSGTVELVKTIVDHNTYGNGGSYGMYIVINHGSGIKSYYAHLSRFEISQGTRVTKGQLIAKSGNTGNSSGPHLHFEIRKNGTAVNPRNYVNF